MYRICVSFLNFQFGQCPFKLQKIVNVHPLTKIPLIKFKKKKEIKIQKRKRKRETDYWLHANDIGADHSGLYMVHGILVLGLQQLLVLVWLCA
jgi:hypothetical protein